MFEEQREHSFIYEKSLSLFKGIQVTTVALVAYFRYLHLFYVSFFFEGMFWFACCRDFYVVNFEQVIMGINKY